MRLMRIVRPVTTPFISLLTRSITTASFAKNTTQVRAVGFDHAQPALRMDQQLGVLVTQLVRGRADSVQPVDAEAAHGHAEHDERREAHGQAGADAQVPECNPDGSSFGWRRSRPCGRNQPFLSITSEALRNASTAAGNPQ